MTKYHVFDFIPQFEVNRNNCSLTGTIGVEYFIPDGTVEYSFIKVYCELRRGYIHIYWEGIPTKKVCGRGKIMRFINMLGYGKEAVTVKDEDFFGFYYEFTR